MARNETTATSTVLLNGEQAKQQLEVLEQKAKDLRKALRDSQKVGDLEGIKKYNKELSETQKQLRKVRGEAFDAQKVLNNLSGAAPKELEDAKRKIEGLMRSGSVKRHSKDWDFLRESLIKVKKELADVNKEMNIGESRSSRLANSINKYFNVGMTAIAGITGVSFAFRKLAEDVAHMDDVYSDVMKTTGMTKKDVLLLNEELKKIDTRTSREELNQLATEAGKLGKESKQDILDFVEAGNQIKVALGEDLGEDAIKNIGKMVGVFADSTKQLQNIGFREQMLSAGSAVNELGASSSASEDYLVQFAGRLGGVSKQAKIAMGDILGFASALDQDMQQVEMSATAFQQFIMKVLAEPAKFAKIAGISVGHFNNLLAKDTNFAIKTVLKALNEKGGFQALIPIFDEMNMDGARAVGVLSSMAGSITKIDEAQKIANKSMWEGRSITQEYNTKNNNLAATLEKSKKEFQETSLELGESLNPILLKSVKGTTYFIRVLVELPKWLKENRGLLLTLTLVSIAYAIAINRVRIANLANLAVEKAKVIASKVSTAATLAQVAVTGYLTGGIHAANLATKAFFRTLGLNPFVAIGLLIAAATVAIYQYVKAKNAATESHKIFHGRLAREKELLEEHSKSILEEKTNLEGLIRAIIQTNNNTELRSRLIADLKEKYPGFLSFLKEENMTNDMLRASLKDVNDQYAIKIKNAALNAKSESFDDAGVKAAQRRIEIEEEIKKLSIENTDETREKIKVLRQEDMQLQRNMKAYQQHATKYRAEANLNDEEVRNMNTAAYASSQIKVWFNSAKDFEAKFKDARDKGLEDQALYYQRQMTEANNYVKFYVTKKAELAKIEKQKNIPTTKGDDETPDTPTTTPATTPTDDKGLKAKENLKAENARLSKEMADASIADLQLTLDSARLVSAEQLAGVKQTLEQEHALKLKQLEEDKQLELNKADLSLRTADEIAADKRFIEQKYRTLTAEENAKFAADTATIEKEQQLKLLSDKLAVTAQGSQEAFDLEKQMRQLAMADELALVEEGSAAALAIREKYRKMDEDAENTLLKTKEEMVFQYAQAGMAVFSELNNFMGALGDRELANFKKNNEGKANFDEEYAQKKADIEIKAAKRAKLMSAFSTIINTAAAVLGALAPPPVGLGPILGIPFGVAAGVQGALQLGTILATPLPEGFAEGGFTDPGDKYEPRGIVHAGEFVANQDAVGNRTLRRLFNVVDHAQKTNTVGRIDNDTIARALNVGQGYSGGGFVAPAGGGGTPDANVMELAAIMSVLQQSNEVNAALLGELQSGIRADVSVSGKGGVKEATDTYNKLIKNARR